MKSFWWWIGGAAAVGTIAVIRRNQRRATPLSVALSEDHRWGDKAPSTARVDDYLAGCVPNGAALVKMNTDTNRVNFCAAAAGWCDFYGGLISVPWRSSAKQIMVDCIGGKRGPMSRWHPKAELASGWRPPQGALAIYHRGDPESFSGHVDRVWGTLKNGFDAVGANERGRRWSIEVTPYSSPALIGFVVDGERSSGSAVLGAGIPPVGFVEPPLTEEEEAFIRSAA